MVAEVKVLILKIGDSQRNEKGRFFFSNGENNRGKCPVISNIVKEIQLKLIQKSEKGPGKATKDISDDTGDKFDQ